ncbi:MAG: response regulator [Rhodospirillaceae bacterium]|nr:response regulator [Rhodospirillaceae bacterium]
MNSVGGLDLGILTGKSVLVVEDDALIALVLEEVLAEAGMNVAGSAASVDAALAQLAGGKPDIAILDASLDGQNSGEVARELQRRGVPFIFATGHREAGLQQHFPGVPILTKPYLEGELLGALAGLFPPTNTGR